MGNEEHSVSPTIPISNDQETNSVNADVNNSHPNGSQKGHVENTQRTAPILKPLPPLWMSADTGGVTRVGEEFRPPSPAPVDNVYTKNGVEDKSKKLLEDMEKAGVVRQSDVDILSTTEKGTDTSGKNSK
jgi:hypothetical protein